MEPGAIIILVGMVIVFAFFVPHVMRRHQTDENFDPVSSSPKKETFDDGASAARLTKRPGPRRKK